MTPRPLPLKVWSRLALYRFLFPVVLIVSLPAMIRRMVRRGNFRRHLGQRFGLYSPALCERFAGKNTFWLQSISVGETLVSLRLAREILERDPSSQVVITVTTSTGYDLAERRADSRLLVLYNPIDLAGMVRRALDVIRPAQLILVEATWPVLLAEAHRRGIPVSLVARLSPRSARRFEKFRGWVGPIFSLLDHVFVQDPADLALWTRLGARSDAILCTGSIKYDEPPAGGLSKNIPRADLVAFLDQLAIASTRPILLAGSTFPGEEFLLAELYLELRKKIPALFLILVPRHVERTPDILADLASLNLKIARRTLPERESDLLLVDTTGELRAWYDLATVVFIGKSLLATGGQNPVEAVLAGKPIVCGPHMENFGSIITQWQAAGLEIQVPDSAALARRVETLLLDPATRQALAGGTLDVIRPHFGATSRLVDQLLGTSIHSGK